MNNYNNNQKMNGTIYFSKKGYDIHMARVLELEKTLKDLQLELTEVSTRGGNSLSEGSLCESVDEAVTVVNTNLRYARNELKDFKIIQYPASVDKVCLGCEVKAVVNGVPEVYKILGHGESNADSKEFAYDTPFARSLINLVPGSNVNRMIGNNNYDIRILSVSPIKN